MKKLVAFIVNMILMVNLALGMAASAETETGLAAERLKIGDYFILGKYNEEPIVWRYAADDEHGKLMVSDKILCTKPFGTLRVLWKDSYIRSWLNSQQSSDEADWSSMVRPAIVSSMDIHEKGFLHEDNFSEAEKQAIKSVTQWTMLPESQVELSENGIYTAYDGVKEYFPGDPQSGGRTIYYDIPELPEHYVGAAYETTDKIFLMDEMQIYHMWSDLGTVATTWRDGHDQYGDNLFYYYYLRTSIGSTYHEIWGGIEYDWDTGNEYSTAASGSAGGIRPAFYLNEETAVIVSGSGTAEEPYVINGEMEGGAGDETEQEEANAEMPQGIAFLWVWLRDILHAIVR